MSRPSRPDVEIGQPVAFLGVNLHDQLRVDLAAPLE